MIFRIKAGNIEMVTCNLLCALTAANDHMQLSHAYSKPLNIAAYFLILFPAYLSMLENAFALPKPT